MLQHRLLAKKLAANPYVGPYRITEEEIGEGSSGTVRVAIREENTNNNINNVNSFSSPFSSPVKSNAIPIPSSDGKKSAVKILFKRNNAASPFSSPSPNGGATAAFGLTQRVKDEANRESKLLHRLSSHPNIIKMEHMEEDDHHIYLFMEYLAEGDLYNYIQKYGPFDEDHARHLFKQMASALEFCHRMKVCHHDFKLENCVIDKDYNLRIIDFGFALDFENRPEGEMFHNYNGSPAYSAPEVLDRKPHSEKVDIFSLGTSLFYLLSAAYPFCDESKTTYEQLCRNVRKGSIVFPDHLSEKVRDLISKMLKKEGERIGWEEIRTHDWVNEGKEGLNGECNVVNTPSDIGNDIYSNKKDDWSMNSFVGRRSDELIMEMELS